MDIEEYKALLQQRYMELTPDEKEIIRRLRGTEVAQILTKIFGAEMQNLLTMIAAPNPDAFVRSRGGLGTRR
jgi:hypothetical protein